MAKTLQEILGYVKLCGVIKAVKTGIPDNLPAPFTNLTHKTLGDSGRFVQVKGTRRTSKRTEYGAPPIMRELKDIQGVDVKLASTFENIRLNPNLLMQLRNYDNYDIQEMGIQEVDRQQAQFRAYFDNNRLAMIYSMLSNGTIWWDSSGNLLPTSSGAFWTVNYNIQSYNQSTMQDVAGNTIITSSWQNANTDIPSQIRVIKKTAAERTGYPLKYAFYGSAVPSAMTTNNYVMDYLSRSVSLRDQFIRSGELPDGLFDLTWVPVYTSFFEDQNGTNQEFFFNDSVIFTPDITRDVYEHMEGTVMVPTTLNIQNDLVGALNSAKMVEGMYSYALMSHRPVGVEMLMGDTSLPLWKIPDAIFQARVFA